MFNNHYGKPVFMRLLGILAAAVLMTGFAFAEGNDTFFAQFDGMTWSFCSGAGAWSTDLTILPDGSFSGDFHDSDMGDMGDDYPNGTVYVAGFHGKMSLVDQVNDCIWKIRVNELAADEQSGTVVFQDGCKYVYTDVYGLTAGDEMLLFKPGTPMDSFTEDMHFWAHSIDLTELPFWFFYSEKNSSGFVGLKAEPGASAADPWQSMTAEQLQKAIGIMFRTPDGAEKTAYRWYADDRLAEMQFFRNGGEYTFRAQPVALGQDEMLDISGLYFNWDNQELETVAGFKGLISQAKSDTGETVECVMWYDNTTGIMHSLSVTAPDVDGLDLAAVAEQIVLPAAE